MDLKTLKDTPPWDWPEGTAAKLLAILRDGRASEAERLVAAELAGDFVVINDDLADALLAIARGRDLPDELRAQAALSLGPVLEQADTDGFEDGDDVPIRESTFRAIEDSLRELFTDTSNPKEVRRRTLEASVRAPQDWHPDAVRAAARSDDEEWQLTAMFCMRFISGFDEQILRALDSKTPEIRHAAVVAAGAWGLEAAWPHIAALVTAGGTAKPLLLAAIAAAASVHPQEAQETLADLADSDDEEIAEAANDALAMADAMVDEARGALDEDDD